MELLLGLLDLAMDISYAAPIFEVFCHVKLLVVEASNAHPLSSACRMGICMSAAHTIELSFKKGLLLTSS